MFKSQKKHLEFPVPFSMENRLPSAPDQKTINPALKMEVGTVSSAPSMIAIASFMLLPDLQGLPLWHITSGLPVAEVLCSVFHPCCCQIFTI
jgi:hypothetical protein